MKDADRLLTSARHRGQKLLADPQFKDEDLRRNVRDRLEQAKEYNWVALERMFLSANKQRIVDRDHELAKEAGWLEHQNDRKIKALNQSDLTLAEKLEIAGHYQREHDHRQQI